MGRPRRSGPEPSEHLPTEWDFAATVLDKLIPLTPFWDEVCGPEERRRQIERGPVRLHADDQPLIGATPEVPGFYLNCGYWAGVMLSGGRGPPSGGPGYRRDDRRRTRCAQHAMPRASRMRATVFCADIIRSESRKLW